MKVQIYEVRAFAEGAYGGNAAGVVLQKDAAGLTSERMQDIAARLGYSETAFVLPSERADFRVRFFTPGEEVDLCGHATIGTFWLLKSLGRLEGKETLTQETRAGVLEIQIRGDQVLMAQASPEFGQILEPEEIFWSLGLTEEDQAMGLPVQIVSTGLKDILVPVDSMEKLRSAVPDFDEIRRLSADYGVTGYHCFALSPDRDAPQNEPLTAWCRNFAPLVGIDEESATGTSSGALAAYLCAYGAIEPEAIAPGVGDTQVMRFAQGLWMGQPSRITASVVWPEGQPEPKAVWVGGTARLAREFELVI